MHTKNRTISILEEQKMYKAGEKERYHISKLFQILNCNDQYHYHVLQSESWLPVGYDAIVFVKCKLTDNILDMYIVESKVRETHFDELIFEKKKLNTMQRERDKFVKKRLPSIIPKIMYISFTPVATYMFDIDYLIENNMLPKLTTMKMNEMTVADNVKKINKQVYLLPVTLAVKKNFKYNAMEYANSLLKVAKEYIEEAKTIITKTYSLF